MNRMEEVARLLGVELGEDFKVEGVDYGIHRFTDADLQKMGEYGVWVCGQYGTFMRLIKGENKVIKILEATEEQKEILKALYVMGFRWVAKDANGQIYVYENKPAKKSLTWDIAFGNLANTNVIKTLAELSNLVKWEDDEPLEIAREMEV